MTKRLRKVNAGSPLMTNAACNRQAAERAFKAGVTITQITTFWPRVFELKVERGRTVLGQRYDYELNDGSGRYETNTRITADSVQECIERYTSPVCEICGEPAGAGGALCPVHLREAGIE